MPPADLGELGAPTAYSLGGVSEFARNQRCVDPVTSRKLSGGRLAGLLPLANRFLAFGKPGGSSREFPAPRFDFRSGELRLPGQLVCFVGLPLVCVCGGARGGSERCHEGVIVDPEVGTGDNLWQLGEGVVQGCLGEPGSLADSFKLG